MNRPEFTNAKSAYYYAREVINGRCPEAEPVIVKEAVWACNYAQFVIQERWPEAEEEIAQDALWAYYYAKDVIKGRWLEAEDTIAKDARLALHYARDVIKGRWPEAEEVIYQSLYCYRYLEFSFPNQKILIKDNLSEFDWQRSGAVGYFAPMELFMYRPISLLDLGLEM